HDSILSKVGASSKPGAIHSGRNTRDWDEYYQEASHEHGNLAVCKYIHDWIDPGDLVWTRDPFGNYYLARVLSRWEYWATEEARRLDIDIANIFRCELKRVDTDGVPGKIVACFRASRTIQKITDDKAYEYSRYLWNTLNGQDIYEINKAKCLDAFMMLDAEETEDVVFLYLQTIGWYVVPHWRKGDSMTFEYLCVNPQDGQVAGVQVKTGNTPLNRDDYAPFPHKVFLFQTNDIYSGVGGSNIECISREQLMVFLDKAVSWLPKSLRRKFEIAGLSYVAAQQPVAAER
ncbi:hypothetical protein, partial [Nitrosomonas sp.]|uniref:hypothetical protein n=1 Tax=Nitrosomonas sp. TaxID=42353 RepID=UPI003305FA1E